MKCLPNLHALVKVRMRMLHLSDHVGFKPTPQTISFLILKRPCMRRDSARLNARVIFASGPGVDTHDVVLGAEVV